MVSWSGFSKIYLQRDPVDFRKSIDGLSGIVTEAFGEQLFSGSLFVFCNRSRNKVKALYFDRTGFALWYKRLEKARYRWPRIDEHQAVISLTSDDLTRLLDGYDLFNNKPHQTLYFSAVA